MNVRAESSSGGAVLVFALLVLVVGGTILGGIAQLAVTQSLGGRAEWESSARRIRLENSRALARQYVLSQMWRGFGAVPLASLGNTVTGGLGGFSVTNVDPPLGYWLSLEQDSNDRINPFNLFERGGFQSAWVAGTLQTRADDSASGTLPWAFQVRTRSPITAGFSFVNHRPATNAWTPARRINMQQVDYAVGFTNLPRMPVTSVTNTNTGDTNGFLGFLLLPKSEAAFGDLLSAVSGVQTNAVDPDDPVAARIEIDLDTFGYFTGQSDSQFFEVPKAGDVVTVNAGITNTNYNVPVTHLLLRGSPAAGGVPLQVVVPESNPNLAHLVLSGDNARIVYFYRQGASSPLLSIETTGGNRTFRIGMTLECAADLDISGALDLQGGIRTGMPLGQSTGTFTFLSETAPTWKYDAIADRMMWLEDQRLR